MLGVLKTKLSTKKPEVTIKTYRSANCLAEGELNKAYVVREIDTKDTEMEDFLFTLGCYKGENVTIISRLADNFVISIKDARYSIDKRLAAAIIV